MSEIEREEMAKAIETKSMGVELERIEVGRVELEPERAKLKEFLYVNPNYFGSIPKSILKPVKILQLNKKYESLECVGLYPELDLMTAVIKIKLPYGYGGDLCSLGSYEYVRFYVDWNKDGDFSDPSEDLGVASVNVHDIPGEKPLCYALAIKISPKKYPCNMPNILRVRAILSWNVSPPPNTPDYVPAWGNVLDTYIQIKPKELLLLDIIDIIDLGKLGIDKAFLNLETSIMKAKTVSPLELKMVYGDEVPEKRINFAHLKALADVIKQDPSLKLKLPENIIDIIDDIVAQIYNTKYEELTCLGLYSKDYDAIMATMKVKLPYGYSGGLCSDGSYEYVTFWADFNNNGIYETCLGTASLNVHDIPSIPEEGLEYAVQLPVDLSKYRKPCKEPRVVRIKATLSWQAAPPCFDPNYKPAWGNSLECLILIPPGVPEDKMVPYISTISTLPVMNIGGNPDSVPGLVMGYAEGFSTQGWSVKKAPFGGTVTIAGYIFNSPDISGGALPVKYKAQYRKFGDISWKDITNKFWIAVTIFDPSATPPTSQIGMWQQIDASGYFSYQGDLKAPVLRLVEGSVLAQWVTYGLDDGLYELRIITQGGEVSNIIKVMVDNTKPNVDINITKVVKDGVEKDAKPCDILTAGVKIKGKFTAMDKHIRYYSLGVSPSGGIITPGSGEYPTTLSEPGLSNADYELDTSGMLPCGYNIWVQAWDRAIVNSSPAGNYNAKPVGFCLKPP